MSNNLLRRFGYKSLEKLAKQDDIFFFISDKEKKETVKRFYVFCVESIIDVSAFEEAQKTDSIISYSEKETDIRYLYILTMIVGIIEYILLYRLDALSEDGMAKKHNYCVVKKYPPCKITEELIISSEITYKPKSNKQNLQTILLKTQAVCSLPNVLHEKIDTLRTQRNSVHLDEYIKKSQYLTKKDIQNATDVLVELISVVQSEGR